MSTAVLTPERLKLKTAGDTALKAAVGFWFVVTLIGQLTFAIAVASFYGLTAARGDFHRWSKFISHGYGPGGGIGNLAIVLHLMSAVAIMMSGAVQLVPSVRRRFPVFHHWNGRIYMLTAVIGTMAGVYMTWFRGTPGDVTQHIGATLNAVLVAIFAGLALRYAMARDFQTHRRWALRLFLAVGAAWMYRITFFLTLLIFKGPIGFDPVTFRGPYLSFMSFAQYLVPLGILQVYFWARDGRSAGRRIAMACGLFILTLGMAAGTFAVSMAVWVPDVKAGFDKRGSIAETLSSTIASNGVDQAVRQYHDLKATQFAAYDFSESELNNLGYQLLRAKKLKEAIRILQLNIEAYPKSSNVYDSLGEAYMDDGNKPLAIVNYQKSLDLNPNNRGAVLMLTKMKAQ